MTRRTSMKSPEGRVGLKKLAMPCSTGLSWKGAARKMGICRMAAAKMMGITPAALSLMGM